MPLFAFGIVFPLAIRPAIYWQFRRNIKRSPSYGCEMTYTFEPGQVTISGDGFHSTFIWNRLYSATVSPKGILLYPQKIVFHWVPASAFASPGDIDTVNSYLQQNGVKTKVV